MYPALVNTAGGLSPYAFAPDQRPEGIPDGIAHDLDMSTFANRRKRQPTNMWITMSIAVGFAPGICGRLWTRIG